jgi:hypothetical protein
MGIFNKWTYDEDAEKKKREELLACLADSLDETEEEKDE